MVEIALCEDLYSNHVEYHTSYSRPSLVSYVGKTYAQLVGSFSKTLRHILNNSSCHFGASCDNENICSMIVSLMPCIHKYDICSQLFVSLLLFLPHCQLLLESAQLSSGHIVRGRSHAALVSDQTVSCSHETQSDSLGTK